MYQIICCLFLCNLQTPQAFGIFCSAAKNLKKGPVRPKILGRTGHKFCPWCHLNYCKAVTLRADFRTAGRQPYCPPHEVRIACSRGFFAQVLAAELPPPSARCMQLSCVTRSFITYLICKDTIFCLFCQVFEFNFIYK